MLRSVGNGAAGGGGGGLDGGGGGIGIGGVRKRIRKHSSESVLNPIGPPGWRWPTWLASVIERLEIVGDDAVEFGDGDGG